MRCLGIEIQECLDDQGNSPFGRWFDSLDRHAARRVTIAISRMENGNFSNVASVGEGVMEYRINFGPGYRIYFGRDGNSLVILVGGGTKARQQTDIQVAQRRWREYRQRK